MTLKIYNTLNQNKEEFKPQHPHHIGLYVCGVTVYDKCHLGHGRVSVIFDVIYRYLKYRFPQHQIEFVRNFTDIDDKIIKRSAELKITWQELTEKYIAEFHQDMQRLGNLNPSCEPKATDHIPEMLQIIETLVQKNIAYEVKGDVFFRVKQFPSYGKLSQKKLEDLEAGARVEVREEKENPLDFALWKKSKEDEPSWPSPWGPGRPGWHIECSAMSMKYLGESFDLHGGGRDLMFPHHENEIAQSEAATGKPFVNCWMHNGFVNVNAEKMSKSLGNFFTLQDILEEYPPEVVRSFLISVHYRSPIDFSDQNLRDQQSALNRFYVTIKRIQDFLLLDPHTQQEEHEETKNYFDQAKVFFEEAMDDDFNTVKVIGQHFEMIREANRLLDLPKKEQAKLNLKQWFESFLSYLKNSAHILGCYHNNPESFFKEVKRRHLKKVNLSEEEILNLLQKRHEARALKDYAKSDEIRHFLLSKQIQVKDKGEMSEWSVEL